MARPREYEPDTVLDLAIETFWQRGYKATSVQDLVEATGLNRGSMYAAFGSKAGLFNAALDRYMRDGALAAALDAADDTPVLEIVRFLFNQLVAVAAEDDERRGCMITNTAVELSVHDEEVRAKIDANLAELEEAFARRIAAAQAKREVDASVDPLTLGRFLVAGMQGLRVMAKVTNDRARLQSVADMVVRAVGG